ncbi:MAG: site-specific integrase [Acidobacteriaceae bacterium]
MDAEGKLHREKAGRKSDAIDLVAKRRAVTLQEAKLPEKFRKKVTFGDLAGDAIEHSKAENDAKVTYDLGLKLTEMRNKFGDRAAHEITKQQIVRYLTNLADDREWKPSTRNRWQAAFSLVFRVGIDNEKINRNPAAGIRRKTENNSKVRFLSAEEELRLRKVITRRFPEFIPHLDLALNTGMRMTEQYSLRWTQVDSERKIVSLPKTKNGRARHIPLNAAALAAFETLKNEADYVFPSARTGIALQSSRGWFRSALEEAKVADFSWHCNRHTFASRLVMAGVDLRTVAELLGHRTLQMVMRYAHLAPEHNAAAVDRLASFSSPRFGTSTDTGKRRTKK